MRFVNDPDSLEIRLTCTGNTTYNAYTYNGSATYDPLNGVWPVCDSSKFNFIFHGSLFWARIMEAMM